MAQPRTHVVELTTAQIETLRRLLNEDTDRLLAEAAAAGPLAVYRLRQAHYKELIETLVSAQYAVRPIVARWGKERPAFTKD